MTLKGHKKIVLSLIPLFPECLNPTSQINAEQDNPKLCKYLLVEIDLLC